jgi:hypothetical protein
MQGQRVWSRQHLNPQSQISGNDRIGPDRLLHRAGDSLHEPASATTRTFA